MPALKINLIDSTVFKVKIIIINPKVKLNTTKKGYRLTAYKIDITEVFSRSYCNAA